MRWNPTVEFDVSSWSFGALAVIAGAIAVIAGAIAAVSGFGIGSVLTPFLMLRMPTSHAVAIVAIPHIWATSLRLFQLRGVID
ncbi:MAG: hypothetical protein ABIQ49_06985 [Gemmatimonadales bacterium]